MPVFFKHLNTEDRLDSSCSVAPEAEQRSVGGNCRKEGVIYSRGLPLLVGAAERRTEAWVGVSSLSPVVFKPLRRGPTAEVFCGVVLDLKGL